MRNKCFIIKLLNVKQSITPNVRNITKCAVVQIIPLLFNMLSSEYIDKMIFCVTFA